MPGSDGRRGDDLDPASGSDGGGPDLDPRQVYLQRLPLDVLARAREYNEGLMREFALMAQTHPDSDSDSDIEVPVRLLELVAALRERFSAFTISTDAEVDGAMARGEQEIDLTFLVPAEARDAAVELEEMLDEADEYCRRGELLTLATPDDLVAFRRWYIGEFVHQIGGAEPTPWR